MKTPKEKAEELFNKYATYAVMWTGGIEVEKQNCKQCALIAQQNLLQKLKDLDIKDSFEEEVLFEINVL
jgi:hypothetical protein